MKQCGRIGKKLINKEKIVQIFDEISYTNPYLKEYTKKETIRIRVAGENEKNSSNIPFAWLNVLSL